jgi:hypothetical protein
VASRERYLVGLDIGTSKVAAVISEVMDDGSLEIIGIGVAEAKGFGAAPWSTSRPRSTRSSAPWTKPS